ncbi:hypothetical protein DSECCO2_414730 [anaerobic digester metagenome]
MKCIDSLVVQVRSSAVQHLFLLFPGKTGVFCIEQEYRLEHIHQIIDGSLRPKHLLGPQGAGGAANTPSKLAAHKFLASRFMKSSLRLAENLILCLVELGVFEPLFGGIDADVGPAFGAHLIVERLHVGRVERQLVLLLGCQAGCKYVQVVKKHLDEGRSLPVCRFAELAGEVVRPRPGQDEDILSFLKIDAFLNDEVCICSNEFWVHMYTPIRCVPLQT